METNKITKTWNPELIMLGIFIIIKLILSLLPISYGIFRDEFYYLSMSKHLGLGYVDVPPLSPLILAGVRFLFGDSFFALHLIPAISGGLFLWLAYLLVKKLNGNSFAVFLTLTTVLLAPYFIAIDSIYTYDTFNKLFWLLFSYLMIRLIRTEDPKYWIYIGIASGVGLLFKITLFYLGFGWIMGLLFTKQRKLLFRREVLLAGVLVLIIFSPYLIWQAQHGFVSLEYYHNYTGKISDFSPIRYIMDQVDSMSKLAFPIWVAGLYYLLFHPQGKKLRSAGITYLVILILSYLLKSKPDLILPFYVVLFTAGSIWMGDLLAGDKKRWWRYGVTVAVIFSGITSLPMARPVLPVETLIRFYGTPTGNVERLALANLPQFYADRFGWEEMTRKVAEVYSSLPAEDQAKACILVSNYGEAGAIEYYGVKYGLPLPPISGHNQYHVWGPGRFTGEVVISVGLPVYDLEAHFQTVQEGAVLTDKYMMPYEKANPICICRDSLVPFQKIKPWLKWLN